MWVYVCVRVLWAWKYSREHPKLRGGVYVSLILSVCDNRHSLLLRFLCILVRICVFLAGFMGVCVCVCVCMIIGGSPDMAVIHSWVLHQSPVGGSHWFDWKNSLLESPEKTDWSWGKKQLFLIKYAWVFYSSSSPYLLWISSFYSLSNIDLWRLMLMQIFWDQVADCLYFVTKVDVCKFEHFITACHRYLLFGIAEKPLK